MNFLSPAVKPRDTNPPAKPRNQPGRVRFETRHNEEHDDDEEDGLEV